MFVRATVFVRIITFAKSSMFVRVSILVRAIIFVIVMGRAGMFAVVLVMMKFCVIGGNGNVNGGVISSVCVS